tara:strand:- start:551 stop:1096 length:546 start_codon:yes stop_codon:yes gene_type:complete
MVEEKMKIQGLKIIENPSFEDDRGYFMEFYNNKTYQTILSKDNHFVQDNISSSKKNVIRGLHFQVPPFDQGKLVQVLQGKALDVVVDIRRESPTFGEHYKIELSSENKIQFWIPSGFAHGFVSLEDDTLFSYKCTQFYSKDHERALLWSDETLNIDWGTQNPIVSRKDQEAPDFKHFNSPF